MEKSIVVRLALLDLSAIFDTINHAILFDCLKLWYWIARDHALLDSYIPISENGRSKWTNTSLMLSNSCMGLNHQSTSLYHVHYSSNLALRKIISQFIVTYYMYPDDTQSYLELDSRNFGSSIVKLADCLEDVQLLMGNYTNAQS